MLADLCSICYDDGYTNFELESVISEIMKETGNREQVDTTKARFKRRIFHASNIIHELSAWKMRRLKQLNSADLNCVRLVSHIRQRQSNIRQKFDCGFRRRISHAANKMHKLCLLARLPSNRFFFLDGRLKCHAQKLKLCSSWHLLVLRATCASKLQSILVLTAAYTSVYPVLCSRKMKRSRDGWLGVV